MIDTHKAIAHSLYRVYPHLKTIADQVREAKPSMWDWHNIYKPQVVNSVGWYAGERYPNDRFLQSTEAYEAVYFDLERWVDVEDDEHDTPDDED